jgi:hypothetical protein
MDFLNNQWGIPLVTQCKGMLDMALPIGEHKFKGRLRSYNARDRMDRRSCQPHANDRQ